MSRRRVRTASVRPFRPALLFPLGSDNAGRDHAPRLSFAIGEYEREADALAAVRENVRAHGPSVVQGIALLAVAPTGESVLVAQGEALLRLILQDSAAG